MSEGRARRRQSIFVGLWVFVIFVSVLDGYLALRFRHDLPRTELNPVGRALLALNGGRVWYLLLAKFMGTVAAATAVLLIYGRWPRVGIAVAATLAAVQLALLMFLFLS